MSDGAMFQNTWYNTTMGAFVRANLVPDNFSVVVMARLALHILLRLKLGIAIPQKVLLINSKR